MSTFENPTQLALAIGQQYGPTPEQSAVITAGLDPVLVIAGAGSGKTETMANRVIWLLATGQVRPSEILGLTFTRKAAGELAERIQRRIGQLREHGLLGSGAADDAEAIFDRPTVSTYNAFANGIFHDNALLLGREPESQLLSESSAWLLARRVVVSAGDDRLIGIGKRADDIVDAVLRISRALAENETDPAEVRRFAAEFTTVADLPWGGKVKAGYADVMAAAGQLAALPVLLDLAAAYAAEKLRLGLVEFSDQVALARAACERSPLVAAGHRDRFKVILLDEYQDTSVGQTRLLSTLFRGTAVMAVGDPHQSIYGWRGASADNLSRFAADFGTGTAPAGELTLSTSWRNPTTVLDAANLIAEPLNADTRVSVARLAPREGAGDGRLASFFAETMAEEAEAVADWMAGELEQRDSGGARRTAAMLFRARRHMEFYADALRRRGVPCHILGIGGLLSTPEIVDLVSTLRVVHDPAAGSALIRLLSGAQWRIGPRDLATLAGVAGWLQERDWAQKQVSDEVRLALRDSVSADDAASIVDALDFVATAPDSHRQLEGFSPVGLERLRRAGARLAFLRSRVGLALPDFVRLVEQELRLDIELVANDATDRGLANLYAFHDQVAAFVSADELGTLGSFLGWLGRAEKADDLGPRGESSEAGVVQLLTIHGSKGLEWDVVAVPSLTEGGLPAAPREGGGWLGFGELPFEFRGDGHELPALPWRAAGTQRELRDAITDFKGELKERAFREERRLAYVAVTRSREALLVSGAFWSDGKRPKAPSRFLIELAEAGLIAPVPSNAENDENPVETSARFGVWPFDPLGSRRERVESAAVAVSAHASSAENGRRTAWSDGIELLLAERRARTEERSLQLPSRIPASRFKDFVDDPEGVAERLLRPMPQRPYRATRLGTLFHSWVEHRSAGVGSLDLIDALVDERDFDRDDPDGSLASEADRLRALQETFEASEWAHRAPVDVEVEIHLALAGQVFVCKLDAVYETDDGYQVVDWKTGKAPRDSRDLALKQTQLALYRLAYARWKGLDPERVDAVFYFVADDTVVRPERLYDEDELRELWSGVSESASSASS